VAKVRAGAVVVFVLSLPLLVGLFFYGPFVLDMFVHRRPPTRFLIPSGFVGWVRIEYRVPNAPPLVREGKYLLARLSRDGNLQTSSDLPEGWGHDEFLYYSGDARRLLSNAGWCKGGMVWGEVTGKDEKAEMVQKFFVGNEDQFRVEVDPAGRTYSPCG
jgi:hypothetical protein